MLDATIELYWGSGVCDYVPALSWFLIAGLVPLALGLTALGSVLLGDWARAQSLAERAARILPGADRVLEPAHDLDQRRRRRRGRADDVAAAGSSRFGSLVGKLRHLVLATGVVVIIVLMVLAASRTTNPQSRFGLSDPLARVAFAVASVVATAALYRFCPRGRLPWRAAAIGAAPAALALWLTPTARAYYLDVVAGKTPVRVFLVLAGILFTCYLASIALLVGAAIAVRRAGRPTWASNRPYVPVTRPGSAESRPGSAESGSAESE